MSPIDPTQDDVYFRLTQEVDGNDHANAVFWTLATALVNTDSSNLTAAQAAFDAQVSFSIPEFGQTQYKTYIEILEDILRSVLGYIKLDISAGKALYYIMDAPSSSDVTDDSTILDADVSSDISYTDMATSISARNKCLPQLTFPDAFQSADNSRALYLHGQYLPYVLDHVLGVEKFSAIDDPSSVYAEIYVHGDTTGRNNGSFY